MSTDAPAPADAPDPGDQAPGDHAVDDDDGRVAYRTCPLCEAMCGLEISLRGEEVVRIRGDRDDVFSQGFLCPKGSTLRQLHEDPDRLRTPLVRRDGRHVPVSWDEAWQAIADGFARVVADRGRDAVASYLGNPNAHNLGPLLYNRPLLKAIGSPNVFSASTVDQRPKEVAAGLMFGAFSAALPDIDRTDFCLILGANPYASNGSLATAPDWPGRLDALVARGGRLVVVDPRRTRTAEAATDHLAIRPGTDPFLLAALVQVLAAEDRIDLGAAGDYAARVDVLVAAVAPFTPEAVAPVTGIAAETIRTLARDLAAAPSACVYGRIGTTVSIFGTVASWLVDALNLCTGNLDRPGGAMFALPAPGSPNTRGRPRIGRGMRIARRSSRVRGLPESLGELPVVALTEEIETPGDGQIRALLCMAGNPVLSTPDSERLDAALASLDFLVAVDIYLNETTRHADVILPAPSALQKSHFDLAFFPLALRNVVNYSEAVLPLDEGAPDEWEILCRLAGLFAALSGDAEVRVDAASIAPEPVDDTMVRGLVASAVGDEFGPLHGRDPDELLEALAPRTGPERLVDFFVRSGPYGDHFGARPDGLSLDVLLAHPHGIDLGPLQPRLPDLLRTPDGMIDAAPEPLVADLQDRMVPALAAPADGLVLVGRRDLRSNNSWMHNIRVLVKGKERCTLQVHPDDAEALDLRDGAAAEIRSAAGAVTAPVEVTDLVMPGVVSLPHGWGHDRPGARLSVAAEVAGVNSNVLADRDSFDAVTGTAVLNGIPVEVRPA